MLLVELQEKELIHPPAWLPLNTQYLTLMGSVAYGVSGLTSDDDVYGWCIPPKELIFPHLSGEIIGFGRQTKRLDQWQQHGIKDSEADKEYDFSVYSIVRYFHLAMENNPNMVDSLFVPDNCILHCSAIGQLVREHRRIFLHKGCFHKFKGYAYSQMHKAGGKSPEPGSKRAKLREEFGCDTKFLYHVVRLCDECQQILTLGDLNLQRAKEMMKAVRRGEMKEDEVRRWFSEQELSLEKDYRESTLPYGPDEAKIKRLLLQCLEHHYGSLDKLGYVEPHAAVEALRQIEALATQCLSKL